MKTIKKAQTGARTPKDTITHEKLHAVRIPKQLEQKGKPDARNSGLAIDTTSIFKRFKSVKDPSYKPSTKKYKSGGSLGMKSVKAGYDKNPGVTRADIITAATKKAKSGKKVEKAFLGSLLGGGKGKEGGGGGIGGMLGGLLGKNGKTVKKAQNGDDVKVSEKKNSSGLTTSKYKSPDGNYKTKFSWKEGESKPSSLVERRTIKGFLTGAPKAKGKYDTSKLKKGGSVKKCKYGCK
jgi:hypothetical protein